MPSIATRSFLSLLLFLATIGSAFADNRFLSTPDGYLDQAGRVRQGFDRPWDPEAGRLGNLRHLHIAAPGCAVRLVSGSENRVFLGSGAVFVADRERVFDDDPDAKPTPRDVVLAQTGTQACPGGCGRAKVTAATLAPRLSETGNVCFTVQLASAHDLLLSGQDLVVLVDRVRQPWLRISVNPSYDTRLWLQDVDIGALMLKANATAQVGGTGRIEYVGASSSDRSSAMYLHELDVMQLGVSATTTGTMWSARIDDDSTVSYYQPAKTSRESVKGYPIEIDGDPSRVEMPANKVDARPLQQATRDAARALRESVLRRVGPTPPLPVSDASLPLPSEAAALVKPDAGDYLARVLLRELPATTRFTRVQLRKAGEGWVEGVVPDLPAMKEIERILKASGEFLHVAVYSRPVTKDGQAFAMNLFYPCDEPGQTSTCPVGDPRRNGAYSEIQVIEKMETILGPGATLHDARLEGDRIYVTGYAATEADALAALERIGADKTLYRTSASGHGSAHSGTRTNITAHLVLRCMRGPRPDGVCPAPRAPGAAWTDGPE